MNPKSRWPALSATKSILPLPTLSVICGPRLRVRPQNCSCRTRACCRIRSRTNAKKSSACSRTGYTARPTGSPCSNRSSAISPPPLPTCLSRSTMSPCVCHAVWKIFSRTAGNASVHCNSALNDKTPIPACNSRSAGWPLCANGLSRRAITAFPQIHKCLNNRKTFLRPSAPMQL